MADSDVMIAGDGEPILPEICDLWLELRAVHNKIGGLETGERGRRQREA